MKFQQVYQEFMEKKFLYLSKMIKNKSLRARKKFELQFRNEIKRTALQINKILEQRCHPEAEKKSSHHVWGSI